MGSFLLSLCSPLLVGVPPLGEAEERSGAGGSGERRKHEEEIFLCIREHSEKMGNRSRPSSKNREERLSV